MMIEYDMIIRLMTIQCIILLPFIPYIISKECMQVPVCFNGKLICFIMKDLILLVALNGPRPLTIILRFFFSLFQIR